MISATGGNSGTAPFVAGAAQACTASPASQAVSMAPILAGERKKNHSIRQKMDCGGMTVLSFFYAGSAACRACQASSTEISRQDVHEEDTTPPCRGPRGRQTAAV